MKTRERRKRKRKGKKGRKRKGRKGKTRKGRKTNSYKLLLNIELIFIGKRAKRAGHSQGLQMEIGDILLFIYLYIYMVRETTFL